MTVDQLLTQMSAREFAEWEQFENQEPLGLFRVEWLLAQLVALTFNVNKSAKSKAVDPLTLMIGFKEDLSRDEGQSPEQQIAMMRQLTNSMNPARRSRSRKPAKYGGGGG